ncbi:hypothetical protein J7L48_08755, partial [bacterium]|nr:hypothetical protein [bacterium]
ATYNIVKDGIIDNSNKKNIVKYQPKKLKNIYNANEKLHSKNAKILILSGGEEEENWKILSLWKHSAGRLLTFGFIENRHYGNSLSVHDYPLLIIPSNSLQLATIPRFKDKIKYLLKSYVERGGTIFCQAQNYGKYYSFFPGNIKGYGIDEVQSFDFQNCVIANYHPILSSIENNIFSMGIDGYFQKFPKDAKVLLRDAHTGMPIMIMYHYGKGNIILSAQYTDYNYEDKKVTKEEMYILRDLFAYYKYRDRNIKTVFHGEKLNIQLFRSRNNIFGTGKYKHAVKVKMYILNPDKFPVILREIKVDPYNNSRDQFSLNYDTNNCEDLGIYWVKYEVIGENGNVLFKNNEAQRFIVRTGIKPHGYPPFLGWITVKDEYFKCNQFSKMTFHLNNLSHEKRHFIVYFGVGKKNIKFVDDIYIDPQTVFSKEYEFFLNAVMGKRMLVVFLFDADIRCNADKNPKEVPFSINHPYIGNCYKVIFPEK